MQSYSLCVKTWLRATMTQQRTNNVAILNTHKMRTDAVGLDDVAQGRILKCFKEGAQKL